MVGIQNAVAVNLTAGEDFRIGQSAGGVYSAVKFEDDGGVAKVIKTVAATDVIVGVLAEEPRTDASTDGENVPVAIISKGGILKGRAGATIAAGSIIVADTTAGRLASVANIAALAANQMGVGFALESAVDGDIFGFLAMTIAGPTA